MLTISFRLYVSNYTYKAMVILGHEKNAEKLMKIKLISRVLLCECRLCGSVTDDCYIERLWWLIAHFFRETRKNNSHQIKDIPLFNKYTERERERGEREITPFTQAVKICAVQTEIHDFRVQPEIS